jgi:hypothetical protein
LTRHFSSRTVTRWPTRAPAGHRHFHGAAAVADRQSGARLQRRAFRFVSAGRLWHVPLTRELWGRADAAALAGLMFAVTPHRLAQSTHLQALMNGWMAVGLWALHRAGHRLAAIVGRVHGRLCPTRA